MTPAAGTLTCTHAYPDDGVRVVTFTDRDEAGLSGTNSVKATVKNVAPVVTAGADVVLTASGGLSRAGSFTDPGADTWTATVSWGDGSPVAPLALTEVWNFADRHRPSASYAKFWSTGPVTVQR